MGANRIDWVCQLFLFYLARPADDGVSCKAEDIYWTKQRPDGTIFGAVQQQLRIGYKRRQPPGTAPTLYTDEARLRVWVMDAVSRQWRVHLE